MWLRNRIQVLIDSEFGDRVNVNKTDKVPVFCITNKSILQKTLISKLWYRYAAIVIKELRPFQTALC